MKVVGVAHPVPLPRHIHVVARPFSRANLLWRSIGTVRVKLSAVVPVSAEVKDTRVVLKHVLSAVAVVNVPVDDEHALDAPLLARHRRRYRYVVEEAKSLAAVRLGVVARRPYDRHAVRALAAHYPLRHLERRARRHESAVGGGGVQKDRVVPLRLLDQGVDRFLSQRGSLLNPRGRVHRLELERHRVANGEAFAAVDQPRALELLEAR
mmetsp:Transcript_95035/g.271753  ORF Transcript_95035/g.271753 Transcript_95035/m.271753 type:complete len:209 (-) Transcript_95035:404-1030(-)